LSHNNRSPVPGLGNHIAKEWQRVVGQEGSDLGVLDIRPPLPRIWANLYSSWNLAFVSAYLNNPMFFSKLLAPIVHVYQGEGNEGLYLWPRVVCLYMHIQYEIMSRTLGGMGRRRVLVKMGEFGRPEIYRFYGDWRSDLATALFGTVNKVASRQFQFRFKSIIKARCSAFWWGKYRMSRFSISVFWQTIKLRLHGYEESVASAKFNFFDEGQKGWLLKHAG